MQVLDRVVPALALDRVEHVAIEVRGLAEELAVEREERRRLAGPRPPREAEARGQDFGREVLLAEHRVVRPPREERPDEERGRLARVQLPMDAEPRSVAAELDGPSDPAACRLVGPRRPRRAGEARQPLPAVRVKDARLVTGDVERDALPVLDDERLFEARHEKHPAEGRRPRDDEEAVVLTRVEARLGPEGIAATAVRQQPLPRGQRRQQPPVGHAKRIGGSGHQENPLPDKPSP